MKRLTETTKWRDPWFRNLSLEAKALYLWLVDNCDNAGVIEIELDVASFDIGRPINKQHITELQDRLQRLPNGKTLLPKFVPFQCGKLSLKCTPHLRVSELLLRHGITEIGGSLVPTLETTLVPTHKTRPDKTRQEVPLEGSAEGNLSRPSWMMAKKWLNEVQKNGADYTEQECKGAWLALDAGGWQWGRREIADWRSALERQIQTDRVHSPNRNGERLKTPMDLKTIIQAKESKATDLRTKYCSDTAMDAVWRDKTKKEEWFALRKEIKQLNNQLSNMA